jgi:hypothetical protein
MQGGSRDEPPFCAPGIGLRGGHGFPRLSGADDELSAHEHGVVALLHRPLGLVVAVDFDKSEPARFTRRPVPDQVARHQAESGLFEPPLELSFGGRYQ